MADLTMHERVLACVESIPVGKVLTYGDVAEMVGSRTARQVGRSLAVEGSAVPWHRVVRSDGGSPAGILAERKRRLTAEGVQFKGDRVDLAVYRWRPEHWPGPQEPR